MRKIVSMLLVIAMISSLISIFPAFAMVEKSSEIITKIDFDSENQSELYSDTTGGSGSYANGELIKAYDVQHGNVMRLPRLCTVASNIYFTNFASSVKACDSEGTKPINFVFGSTISVSVDVKFGDMRSDNGQELSDLDLSNVYVGLVFSDMPCGTIGGFVWDNSSPGGLYYHKSNKTLFKIGKVDTENSDWQTISGLVSVPLHTLNEIPTLVLFSEKELWANTDSDIYIDNINMSVVEYFDPGSVTPTSLITGFEVEDYDEGVVPYTHKFDKQSDFNSGIRVDDSVNTKNVGWITNSETDSYEGKGFLYFDNSRDKYSAKSEKSNAAALFNPDGTQFKVVAGVRYRVKYAIWLDANGYLGYPTDEVIDLVTSYKIPDDGLDNSYAIVQNSHVNRLEGEFNKYDICEPGARGRYNIYEGYFEAVNTGNLYITMYSSQGLAQEIKIDSLSIVPETEEPVTRIRYMAENGNLLKTCLGKPGIRIVDGAMAANKEGYTFDGWYTQDGQLFSELTFPEEDVDLYPRYKLLDSVPEGDTIDWSKPVGTGFEDTEALLKFYGSYNNIGTAPYYGVRLMNDPENAHSGNNYMGFMATGMWLELGQNRRFKFYSEDTPNNWIILEPYSSYKVTYYIKYMYFSGLYCKFTTVGYSLTEPEKIINGYGFEEYISADLLGEYKKVEQVINTGTERVALGLELYSGIVVAAVDDVSVEKLGTVKVHFESNGGSSVEDIEMRAYDYAVEPDYPIKNGYNFVGWYYDKELKNIFSFVDDMIKEDLTLYAKWEKVSVPEVPEKKYETVYEIKEIKELVKDEIPDIDTIVETETDEPNEAISIVSADIPSEETDKADSDNKQSKDVLKIPWLPAVIIAVLVVTGVIIVIVVTKKHRAKKV